MISLTFIVSSRQRTKACNSPALVCSSFCLVAVVTTSRRLVRRVRDRHACRVRDRRTRQVWHRLATLLNPLEGRLPKLEDRSLRLRFTRGGVPMPPPSAYPG